MHLWLILIQWQLWPKVWNLFIYPIFSQKFKHVLAPLMGKFTLYSKRVTEIARNSVLNQNLYVSICIFKSVMLVYLNIYQTMNIWIWIYIWTLHLKISYIKSETTLISHSNLTRTKIFVFGSFSLLFQKMFKEAQLHRTSLHLVWIFHCVSKRAKTKILYSIFSFLLHMNDRYLIFGCRKNQVHHNHLVCDT